MVYWTCSWVGCCCLTSWLVFHLVDLEKHPQPLSLLAEATIAPVDLCPEVYLQLLADCSFCRMEGALKTFASASPADDLFQPTGNEGARFWLAFQPF